MGKTSKLGTTVYVEVDPIDSSRLIPGDSP